MIFAPTAATSIATAETDILTGAIFGMTADVAGNARVPAGVHARRMRSAQLKRASWARRPGVHARAYTRVRGHQPTESSIHLRYSALPLSTETAMHSGSS